MRRSSDRGLTPYSGVLFLRSCLLVCVAGWTRAGEPEAPIAAKLDRRGDEIMVCGQLYHTTAPVVLWLDPGGYDAYRLEPRFAPPNRESNRPVEERSNAPRGSRYGLRRGGLCAAEVERVRGGGWDLPLLRRIVDQFVIHFDARGTSRGCFEVLHDFRGLSVHFLLDLDGTIYQTLDVKEQAWHATIANSRSIGIEIANIGAYAPGQPSPLDLWYRTGEDGRTLLVIPGPANRDSLRERGLLLRPARDRPIKGVIQGQRLVQYDFTDRQYESLARLTATLCTLFPEIRCDYPRDAAGTLATARLTDPELARYHGILGHYHVQTDKVDPGPAFQWDRLIREARPLVRAEALEPPPTPRPRSRS